MLERKLREAGIPFAVNEDVDEMIRRGFRSAPMLEADGEVMEFKRAVDWASRQGMEEKLKASGLDLGRKG